MTTFERRDRLATSPAHDLALDCLAAGIDAAHPRRAVTRHCSLDGETLRINDAEYDLSRYDSIRILGGGKAADTIAAAVERLLENRVEDGVVVTNEQTATPASIEVLEGDHPTPGAGSVAGARTVLDAARSAADQTLVIAAIAGGGSALLCAPVEDLTVEDVRAVTQGLLESGASIDEINTVRRAISEIKGGGLAAAAAPATVVGVLVSDVVGDDPAVIASGPTVPIDTDPAGALDVLDRYDIEVPAVQRQLTDIEPSVAADTEVDNHVVASSRDAVDAARDVAEARGFDACVLSIRIEGDSTESGRFHAAIASEVQTSGDPVEPPAVLLSGGETTVRVTGSGHGGPNQEFALAGGLELPTGTVLGAVDTDGRDGSTDAAGAVVDCETVDDSDAARDALTDNDSYPFLKKRDSLLVTGATGTNVNDLRVLVVPERS